MPDFELSVKFYDFLGLLGVFLVILTYFLIQVERLSSRDFLYSFLNFIGSILIVISLFFNFNLASFVIEIAWMSISTFGMIKAFRR